MNADLTFNTIVFKKSFDEKGGSERQSIARGINTPDKLTVKNQEYVDSVTKVAGKRFTVSVDRYDVDAQTREILSRAYLVIAVPETATQAAIDNVVATFKAVVADANLIANVLNNET